MSVITKAGENAPALQNGNCKYSKGLASLLRSIDLAPLGEALISPSVQAATQHAGNTWLNEPADFELKVVSTVLTEVPTTCSIRNIRTF
ncbi:hypothetical protein N9V86_04170 [Opitutales bacterium]|nr:hypothetical protein [Opitutales bacterium]